jgi:hypothetical protein
MFLLRPDDETNNAFTYCLAVAAERYGIAILGACAMSNHHHTEIFDRLGNYPEFLEYFHKLLARSQNALRGRWENFWSTEQVSAVRLVDREDVLRKLAYVVANPVLAHLVDTVAHWPGVNTFGALRSGREIAAHRPRHFFRADGPMPREATLTLVIPEELGDREQFITELVELVRAKELECKQERHSKGTRIVGRANVLRQSWSSCPRTWAPRRTLSPRVAAHNKWSRIEALGRNREFVAAYRAARERFAQGHTAAFPIGTYWLRRFANVPLTPPLTGNAVVLE